MSTENIEGVEAYIDRLHRLYVSKQFQGVVDAVSSLPSALATAGGVRALHGLSLMALNRCKEAVRQLQEAHAENPADEDIKRALGQCLRRAGLFDDALPFLVESFYLEPSVALGTDLMRAALAASEEDRELIDHVFKSFYENFFADRPGARTVFSPYVPAIDWCRQNSITPHVLDSGGETKLRSAEGTPLAAYDAPPARYAVIPQASTVCGLDWVIAPTGEVLDGTGLLLLKDLGELALGFEMFTPYVADPPRGRVLYASGPEEIYIDEDVVFLSAPRVHHFGHWVYDYLARLRPRAPRQKVFTQANLTKAQRETLTRFGLGPSELIEGQVGVRYRFRSVTASIFVGEDSTYALPSTVQFIYRAMARNQVPAVTGAKLRRYFLERSQTDRGRSVANSDEFNAVLAEFNIETIRRPELSVAEQDERFSEAGIIVTPFGSDTVTWHQVRPGTDFVLLEFRDLESIYQNIDQIVPRYCAILGMRLHYVYCGLVRRKGRIAYHGDLEVDCAALRRTLSEIISRRASQ